MDIKKFICLSLSLSLILGIVDSFEFKEEELKSEEGMQRLYERWRVHHNVAEVNPMEKAQRFNVFKTNVQHVHRTNKMNKPYTLKLNKFATMTNHEFKSTYAGSKIKHYRALRGPRDVRLRFMYENATNLPNKIDWRTLNAVTPTKNQGLCGGCWAFSTVVAVEGINAIRTKKLVSLSEQHLIDCETRFNEGCDGGLMEPAFIFIKESGGLAVEKNYPFTSLTGHCDQSKIGGEVVTIDGYEDVPENDEEALLKAVAHQPVSAAIEANGHDFQFYSRGIFTGKCGVDVNHAVAVVGYDESDDGMKYWLVKNSWGPYWGEDGYVKLQRGVPNSEGLCGIAVEPSYAIKRPNTPLNHEL